MNRFFNTLLPMLLVVSGLFSCSETSNHTNDSHDTHDEAQHEHTMISPVDLDAPYTPGEGWQLVWSDEFDGDSLNTDNWNRQVVPAGKYNAELQRYTNSTENAYVEDGALVIKTIHEGETHEMDQYTSARLNTANKHSWKYGKIVARMKLPYGKGMWPAFWMLSANIDENGGDTPWPQAGEIDIIELWGSRDDAVVEANIHYADANQEHTMMGPVGAKLETGIFADGYHTFALEWDEQSLTWLVDEQVFHTTPITDETLTEFHEEFFILFNVAVGGMWTEDPDDSTVFPQHMYVDWVRVYQK